MFGKTVQQEMIMPFAKMLTFSLNIILRIFILRNSELVDFDIM